MEEELIGVGVDLHDGDVTRANGKRVENVRHQWAESC